MTARGTQSHWRIAWSFYAGAVGSWVIVTPSQVCVRVCVCVCAKASWRQCPPTQGCLAQPVCVPHTTAAAAVALVMQSLLHNIYSNSKLHPCAHLCQLLHPPTHPPAAASPDPAARPPPQSHPPTHTHHSMLPWRALSAWSRTLSPAACRS